MSSLFFPKSRSSFYLSLSLSLLVMLFLLSLSPAPLCLGYPSRFPYHHSGITHAPPGFTHHPSPKRNSHPLSPILIFSRVLLCLGRPARFHHHYSGFTHSPGFTHHPSPKRNSHPKSPDSSSIKSSSSLRKCWLFSYWLESSSFRYYITFFPSLDHSSTDLTNPSSSHNDPPHLLLISCWSY